MTTDPHEPIQHIPVSEIIPSPATSPLSDPSRQPDRATPITVIPLPHPRAKSRLPWLIGSIAAIVLIGTAVWYWLYGVTPPVQYKTGLVDRGPITAIVTATGMVNPVVSVQVGSQVSGKIEKLFVDYNSPVTQGQPLAQIDQLPFQSRVSQARAAVNSAKSNMAKATNLAAQRKLEHTRMILLLKQGFVSQADLDLAATNYRDADANVQMMQAQLEQAQATLDSAELELGYTTMYSPVNGIVVSRAVDVGQTVAASFQTPTLFVIAQDLTKMQVNANVSESDIGGVAEGKTASFRVDAYPKYFFDGTVTQVRNAPISVQNVVTYDVVITVDNKELKLKPGMTANVTIVTAKKESPLRVPNGALRFRMPNVPVDKKVSQVWVFDPENKTHQTGVTTGIADSLFTEITEGSLKEGDRVILGIETPEEQAQKKLPPGFDSTPRMR